ncbi:hypothetical protein [Ramlibacter humi]|uniref:Uncharacterized protein n=1 Tax=Ramlibacter humi TaxID=2530451 RepID=A0A4Z0BJH1_9BURK|nr:hypothetical protein [Ramlibacter humi]TFY98940.1 hypothetical protein EZ216_15345 [Ramlibacter humi]
MGYHTEAVLEAPLGENATSLEASDDFDLPARSSHYCPVELLGTFTLLMAGHGRCVSSSMMLGDREYAMWQLARAQTLPDDELHQVAARLFGYFDDPRGWGTRA